MNMADLTRSNKTITNFSLDGRILSRAPRLGHALICAKFEFLFTHFAQSVRGLIEARTPHVLQARLNLKTFVVVTY